jgi:hypothetical protein
MLFELISGLGAEQRGGEKGENNKCQHAVARQRAIIDLQREEEAGESEDVDDRAEETDAVKGTLCPIRRAPENPGAGVRPSCEGCAVDDDHNRRQILDTSPLNRAPEYLFNLCELGSSTLCVSLISINYAKMPRGLFNNPVAKAGAPCLDTDDELSSRDDTLAPTSRADGIPRQVLPFRDR